MSKPVFIYSSWRTASTWIWKKFRDQQNAYAYCEVYHDELASADMVSITKIGPQSWNASRHPDAAPYFLEFTPLFTPGRQGIAGMTPDLVLEKMFPPIGDALQEEETDYLKRLIAVAESADKTPVLTCTRNLGRALATRLTFPDGVHIVTVRNLWHQWMSFCNQHHLGYSWFLEQIDRILCAAPIDDPMLAHLRQRFPPAEDLIPGDPPTARLFYAFVGLHLYLYARAFQAADIVVDINRLAIDSGYRKDVENKIHELTGLSVDFSDVSCRVEYGPASIPSLQELRANIEPLMLVACASTEIKADDKAGCELRRIVNELYDEVEKYDFYTQSLRNEYRKLVQANHQTSAELPEIGSLQDDRGKQLALDVETLNSHSAVLNDHGERLAGHTAALDNLERSLATHTVALEANAGTLSSHSAALASHAGELSSQSAVLDTHAGMFVGQSVELNAYSKSLNSLARTLTAQEEKVKTHVAGLAAERRKTLELDNRIRRLERRFDKGPFHIRQLFRHPKAFAGDVLGLKMKSEKICFRHLKEGFVDENKSAYLSLKWMLRQPGKTVILFVRHPRKAIRFILRHPRKFFAARPVGDTQPNEVKMPQEVEQVSDSFTGSESTALYIHRKPLLVAVDLTPMRPGGANGGNKYATLALLDALGKSPNYNFRFCFITSSTSHHEVQAIARPQDKLICVNHNGPYAKPFGEMPRERDLPGAPDDFLTEGDADVLYCPFGDIRFGRPGLPAIVTIVDLLFKDWPHSLTAEEIQHREQYVSRSISRADRILCISRTVMERVRTHYPESAAKLFYSYLPIHERLATERPVRLEDRGKPYFFFPANYWRHKNHEVLLVSFQIYRSRAGHGAWDLVLSGSEDSRTEEIRGLAATLGLSDHIRFLGFVTDEELALLYANAGALVFPSLHEGFGIPPVEAMSFGIPMIIGDAYSTPEICGNACIKVNPRRPQDLAEAMLTLSSDPELAEELVRLGRLRLKLFNLDAEAEKLARELWLLIHDDEKQYAVGFPAAETSRIVLPTPKDPERWTFTIGTRSLPPARLSLYIGERPFGSYSPEHYDDCIIKLTCEPRESHCNLSPAGLTKNRMYVW